MPYAEVVAAPALRSLVECYWAISGPSPEHRVLPDGCIDVLLDGATSAQVVGTMTRALLAPPSSRGVIGIRFRPGEAARLLPAAPRELTDRDAPLGDLWSSETAVLEDTLASALDGSSLEKVAPLLDAILSRQLARVAGPVDVRIRAATDILSRGGSVREAAAAACLSERQLARRFAARVGIAPKTFGRVMRLQRAAGAMASGTSVSSAATLAGYADQAHLTRDTRDLAGVTPRMLMRELTGREANVSDSFKTADPAAA